MSLNIEPSSDIAKISSLILDRSFLAQNPKEKEAAISLLKTYLSEYLEKQRNLQGTLTDTDFFNLQQRILTEVQKQQKNNQTQQTKKLSLKETQLFKKIFNVLLYKMAEEKAIFKNMLHRIMFRLKLTKRLRAYYQHRRRKIRRAAEKEREKEFFEEDKKEMKEDEARRKEMEEWEKHLHQKEHYKGHFILRVMSDEELYINATNTSQNVSDVVNLMRSQLGLESVISEKELKDFQQELGKSLFELDKTPHPEAFSQGLNEKLFNKLDEWHERATKHLEQHHQHDHVKQKIFKDCFQEVEKDLLSWMKREHVKPRFSDSFKHQKKEAWEKLKVSAQTSPTSEEDRLKNLRQTQELEAANASNQSSVIRPVSSTFMLRKEMVEAAELREQAEREVANPPQRPSLHSQLKDQARPRPKE